MSNEWKKPQVSSIGVSSTKEEPTPYFYWPWSPECDNAANHTGEKCPKVLRPCKYYSCGKCTAPVTPPEIEDPVVPVS